MYFLTLKSETFLRLQILEEANADIESVATSLFNMCIPSSFVTTHGSESVSFSPGCRSCSDANCLKSQNGGGNFVYSGIYDCMDFFRGTGATLYREVPFYVLE
jgi:hypothetical protein